jgi:hypothetical protein
MPKVETFDQLPENHDSRLSAILSEPMSDDVIVSFYYIAVSKNPRANYRWELHRDGRLFVVHHTGQNPLFEVPFDQPFPAEPARILADDEIHALYAQLEQANFFEQPELQRIFVEGGSYVVLRARRNNIFHQVVYENVEGPLVEYLYSVIG